MLASASFKFDTAFFAWQPENLQRLFNLLFSGQFALNSNNPTVSPKPTPAP